MTTTGDSKHTLYTHYTHTLQSTPSTVAGRPPFTNRAQHNSFKHNYNTCMENPFGPYLFLAVGPTPDSDRQATGLNVSVRLETKLSGLCSSGWMSVKAVRPLLPVWVSHVTQLSRDYLENQCDSLRGYNMWTTASRVVWYWFYGNDLCRSIFFLLIHVAWRSACLIRNRAECPFA